jgi:putative transposase
MQVEGLRGVSRRKAPRTTQRKPGAHPAPDLVQRNFTADAPDRLWVADITYVATWGGWLYLAVVVDAWSRKVVGWAMSTDLRTALVMDALHTPALRAGAVWPFSNVVPKVSSITRITAVNTPP